METKVLSILKKIDAPVDCGLVEDCHCLPSKENPKKVTLKLNPRKDASKVLLNKKKLKNVDPETVNLPYGTKIYINESLCTYYKKLWFKCKKLWDAKHILSFWVSNASIRVKLKNEAVSIITHYCELANLSPDNPLRMIIRVKLGVQVIPDYSCVMSASQALIQNLVKHLGRIFFQKQVKALGCWLFLLRAPSWVFEWVLYAPLVYDLVYPLVYFYEIC